MEFWKMNGAGNDFIVVDDRQDAIPDEKWPEIIRTVCERHMSIGADGFMVVKKPTYGGDYKMLFFNSDGSMGEMCGNGARCICRYGYENGLAGEVQKVETTAGSGHWLASGSPAVPCAAQRSLQHAPGWQGGGGRCDL